MVLLVPTFQPITINLLRGYTPRYLFAKHPNCVTWFEICFVGDGGLHPEVDWIASQVMQFCLDVAELSERMMLGMNRPIGKDGVPLDFAADHGDILGLVDGG